jgi:hypothetical protein
MYSMHSVVKLFAVGVLVVGTRAAPYWCNPYTCDSSQCTGASVCAEVKDGSYCGSWCNAFTGGSKYCAGCDCQRDPENAEKDPATCPTIHFAGVYGRFKLAKMKVQAPDSDPENPELEWETDVSTEDKMIFVCGPAGPESYLIGKWKPSKGEKMPTRADILKDAPTDGKLCLANPYPEADMKLKCVQVDELNVEEYYVTKVTCDCFVKEMVSQEVKFGAQCKNDGLKVNGCERTEIENEKFPRSTDPAYHATEVKCTR